MSPDNSQICSIDMKKIPILLLLLLPLCAWSQDRLKTGPVFEGSVVSKERMIETLVKGGSIREYGLSVFRSVRFDVDESEFQTVSSLVLDDAATALNKETEIDRGKLRYALMSFSPAKRDAEFLCFQSRTNDDGSCSVILVYMQGNTTLADLMKMFKKNTKQ